ncbi:MAG: sensor domain-containing protein [Ilumatobacter sp.]|uniref:sensor domain-containing protein n=1 Tax=Ilumatobacter sp. TaxID=1967498 RepID=UPI00262EF3BB|nr:sensor domain-containing protein [Ilumatobacter sp.]MDJ0768234.1 sensor domain-containing protein [Ilumatobacter sp.]
MLQRNNQHRDRSTGFFGVIAEPASYGSILYLLLGLPLGTLYFSVIVTGVSLGIGLMPLALIGIPIIIGQWYVNRAFMHIERGLAAGLLQLDIDKVPPVPAWPGGLWRHFKAVMADKVGWRGMLYLLLRFPVGVFTFSLAVTLVSTSLGMTFAPTYMWTSNDIEWFGWDVDPFPWSFALVPIGIVLTFVSLHLMNALARACGRWTQWTFSRERDD